MTTAAPPQHSARVKLGVNIDHVATLRQARYRSDIDAHNAEPNIVAAAQACMRAGAHCITVHLREDRRHIQDADVHRLRAEPDMVLNLEMANTPGILAIALKLRPDEVCIVPENRQEVTTEGGLNVLRARKSLARTVETLHSAGIRVSLFIEPDRRQIEASHEIGADMVELHTGAFANARGAAHITRLERLREAAGIAHGLGLLVNAGHGINYENIAGIRTIPHLAVLNIGHSIICRALSVGLSRAVREMLAAMQG